MCVYKIFITISIKCIQYKHMTTLWLKQSVPFYHPTTNSKTFMLKVDVFYCLSKYEEYKIVLQNASSC